MPSYLLKCTIQILSKATWNSDGWFFTLSYLPSDLMVEFTTDIYTVTEDSGTVTVCLISSVGISEPLVVMVIASLKTSDDAACE